MRALWILVVMTLLAAGWAAAPADGASGSWPVAGAVVRGFDPPEVRWGAGHRGVDLAGEPGAVVVAPAAGVVSFAGVVAGKPVVVVDHGAQRTTLEPVVGTVRVGHRVAAAEPVGRLVAGHRPCPGAACLHWGLKRGDEYLDPLSHIVEQVRLLPTSAVAEVEKRAAAREAARVVSPLVRPVGPGPLSEPTTGRLGSPFGMRFHPIFREWRMHNGIDLSAPCGTPLLAAADGVVTHRGHDPSGGWRLVLSHGTVDGVDVQTVYLHAEGYRVRAGDRVTRGEVVGTVGNTGWSTGCHLHFGVKADGRHVDPLPWLGRP